MLTYEEIQALSPEDLANYNRMLGRKLLKRIAIKTAITVAVVVTVAVVSNKIAKSLPDADED